MILYTPDWKYELYKHRRWVALNNHLPYYIISSINNFSIPSDLDG